MAETTAAMKRDTWKRDGKKPGVYWRYRAADASGRRGKSWAYYDTQLGRIVTVEGGRQAAIDAKAKAGLRKSSGLPAPDTSVTVAKLAEQVRETKRRRLADSSFYVFEHALDTIVLPSVGHLKPSAVGADRCARLIRDLQDRGLAPSTIRRYLSPLSAIFKLAIRRGVLHTSPLAQLGEDERATGGGVRDHYEWSTKEISALIAASERVARRPGSRYDYSAMIRVLVMLGLRIGEAQAIRVEDVDLLEGVLHVRHSWGRKGRLGPTKTKAGVRDVPLSPGIVELFVGVIPAEAEPEQFVFHARGNPHRPISYWNFRKRGFLPALEEAALHGKGITIHGLRSAAVSIYAASGLTLAETADVMGQEDALTTWKHYLKLFDRSKVSERIREAQESVPL
jgi:integrase